MSNVKLKPGLFRKPPPTRKQAEMVVSALCPSWRIHVNRSSALFELLLELLGFLLPPPDPEGSLLVVEEGFYRSLVIQYCLESLPGMVFPTREVM